jgi:hypothetical protein
MAEGDVVTDDQAHAPKPVDHELALGHRGDVRRGAVVDEGEPRLR